MSNAGPSRSPKKDDNIAARRKAFLLSLMKPSNQRGYVNCRLCHEQVWGPNGRYHMEKCPVLSKARKKADDEGLVLDTISGIPVDEEVFKSPKDAVPKPAKISGFMISSTVDINDPLTAPSVKQQRLGARLGRKGYVRCIYCNTEVYAPNAKHHAASCKNRQQDGSKQNDSGTKATPSSSTRH